MRPASNEDFAIYPWSICALKQGTVGRVPLIPMYISTANKRVTQVSYLRLGAYRCLGQNNYCSPHMGFGIALIEGLNKRKIAEGLVECRYITKCRPGFANQYGQGPRLTLTGLPTNRPAPNKAIAIYS